MATQVQNRRGTTAEHSTFTGAVGEVTIDTDKDTVVVHDGSTAGGRALLREDGTNSALALGSAGTPSLKFTGDTNTGIYSPGADQVAISTGGFGRLFINSTGSIGINTSSIANPGTSIVPLEIKGTATDRSGALVLSTSDSSQQAWQYFAANAYRSGTSTNHDALFITNNTERLRITSAGLVGVGTSSPTVSTQIETVKSSSTTWAANTIDDICRIYNSNTSTNNASAIYSAYCNYGDGTFTGARFGAVSTGSYSAAFVTALRDSDGIYKERLRLDSSGRLGIGTSSPSTALHAFSTGTEWLGQFGNITANGSNVRIRYNAIGAFAANSVASNLLLNPDGGNIGIGTTGPASTLHVVGTGRFVGGQNLILDGATGTYSTWYYNGTPVGDIGTANATFSSGGSNTDFGITARSATSLVFGVNTTERARIDSSGRLLVGTSSAPTVGDSQYGLIRTQGNTSSASGFGVFSIGRGQAPASITSGSELGHIYFTANDGSGYASISAYSDAAGGANDYPGRLVFSTTADSASFPTERMRIDNAGNVMIRTTSSNPNNSNSAFFNIAGYIGVNHINGTGSGTGFAAFNYNAGEIGSITQNGTTAVSYNTTSDYRLKENVIPVTDGIARLQQLKPSRFNFIADPERTVDGFIAHEVQDVIPEAITGEKDAVDDEGNPKYQGIDQSKLVPLLTAALQEAIGEIESLKARVAALESA